jgi:hypothetical protein
MFYHVYKACFARDIVLLRLAAVESIPERICRHAAMYAVALAGWAVAALQLILLYYCRGFNLIYMSAELQHGS